MARNNDIADRLHAIAIRVLRYAREADRETGLGPARLSALSVLVFGGPHTLAELASTEQVSAPTMTRVVQGLERADLVRRQPSSIDGRSSLIRATQRGRALMKRARQARLKRIGTLLERARPNDLAKLNDALMDVFAGR
jgi:DNA-binding MarR family transcriptional regulator